MILVVLVHVHHKNYLQLDWVLSAPVERVWSAVNLVLTPVRIPLFFTISGMLVASAITRPWRLVAAKKVAQPAYLYVLWITVALALYWFLGSSIDGLSVHTPLDYLALLIIPSSTLWYLYALALYFVVAKAARRFPLWVTLGAAGVISVGAFEFAGDAVPARVAQNLVFFLAAAYLPGVVRCVADRASLGLAVVATVLYGAVVGLYLLELDLAVGIRTLAALVAVWAGVTIVSVLTQWSGFARIVGYIGRNTLPIYVMHLPLLAVFSWLTADSLSGTSVALAVIYPPFVVAGLVGASVLLHRALLAVRADLLFALPLPTAARVPAQTRA